MRTFSHVGCEYVQGEPIPPGHPALPKGTPYFISNSVIEMVLIPDCNGHRFFSDDFFFAVPVPAPPEGYRVKDFREPSDADDVDWSGVINDMGRKRFILEKQDGPEAMNPECPSPALSGAYTLGPAMQRLEAEAEADVATGRTVEHDSIEDFKKHLEQDGPEAESVSGGGRALCPAKPGCSPPALTGAYTPPAFRLAADEWPTLPYSCRKPEDRPLARMTERYVLMYKLARQAVYDSSCTLADEKAQEDLCDAEQEEATERAELARLKRKFGGDAE